MGHGQSSVTTSVTTSVTGGIAVPDEVVKSSSYAHHVQLEVDLRQLEYNALVLRKHFKERNCRVAADLSANAYGHGVDRVALALDGSVDYFCVSDNREAVAVRNAGIRSPIVRLRCASREEVEESLKLNLMVEESVGSIEEAKQLDELAAKHQRIISVHLNVDVGAGFMSSADPEQVAEAGKFKNLYVSGVSSLLPNAWQEADTATTRARLAIFRKFLAAVRHLLRADACVHMTNALIAQQFPEAADGKMSNVVRLERALYGLLPNDHGLPAEIMSAVEWKSQVACVRQLVRGSTIGFGKGSFVCPRDSVVLTIPVGWADGYCRELQNKGVVLVGGRRCPLIGPVAMDVMCVDATNLHTIPQLGDEVVLLGSQAAASLTPQDLLSTLDAATTLDEVELLARAGLQTPVSAYKSIEEHEADTHD